MVTKHKKTKKRFGVNKPEDRNIIRLEDLPQVVRRGKHDLFLVLNFAGEPTLRTPPQITRFAEHYESQGFLTARSNLPVHVDERNVPYYANYLSAYPIPLGERDIMVSKLAGKMEGMRAISTSPLLNRFCQKQAYKKCKIDSHGNVSEEDEERMRICRMCYSVQLLTPGESGSAPHELGSKPGLARNTRLLSQNIIEKIPRVLPSKKHGHNWFRFNAEGELVNETHLINLANIAIANPTVTFTLWTKRPDIVQNVFYGVPASSKTMKTDRYPVPKQRAMMQKPKNLKLIRSSPLMNVEATLPKGFDKVFTVYTPEYLAEHPEVNVNCQKHCVGCGLCYTDNKVIYIHENLKPGSSLVGKMPDE
jgi:hypothetical protein